MAPQFSLPMVAMVFGVGCFCSLLLWSIATPFAPTETHVAQRSQPGLRAMAVRRPPLVPRGLPHQLSTHRDGPSQPDNNLGSEISMHATGRSIADSGLYLSAGLSVTFAVATLLSYTLRRWATSDPSVPLVNIALAATSGLRVGDVREQMVQYFEDIVGMPAPMLLGGLLENLHHQGHQLVNDPALFRKARKLHPLLIPLAEGPGGRITCLLRRMRDESAEDFAVVVSKGGLGSGVLPVARSVTEAVRRACAEADSAGDSGLLQALVESCAAGPRLVYGKGEDQGLIGRYGVDKYITLRIGTFPDLCEDLIASHLERGDKTSAMVVCEKMSRDINNMAWTQLRQAQLLRGLGDNRPLEIRDCARIALHGFPTWTVGLDNAVAVTELLELAEGVPSETDGSGIMLRSVQDVGQHKEKKSRDRQLDKLKQGEITPQQVAYERAGFLMDAVALGAGGASGDWADATFITELADLCEQAGLVGTAKFIRS